MSSLAIEVRGLRKTYGQNVAVDGIDLSVATGEIFGLLGPNGAGKTSTIEILEGIRARSSGEARVLGLDPTRESAALKDRIGVCLQSTNLPDNIRVGEAMRLFSRLYSRGVQTDRLLERVDLADKKHAFYRTLSGGQKQRLAIALALVNAPSLVFFDEPTTGLDPQVRREIHTLIGELRAENCTVLLTTHYIEEAERLCGRVAIMDRGRVVAADKLKDLRHPEGHGSPLSNASETFANATANLLAAWRAGVTIIPGSDAGNPYIIHGPTVQRELALWVEAGIPAAVALQAATRGAAKVLRAEKRIGLIAPDHQATFILVDGDPVADIHALERISTVVFRGENVNRADLLKSTKEP